MSGYRNYVPWPKTSTPSYTSKKDSSSTSKYETSYSRTRPEAKKLDDKSSSSSLSSKYGAYGAGYQRDSSTHTTSALPTRTDLTTRYKSSSEKKDTSHPPITYRPLTRTTTSRSRDPSPITDRDKTDSSSSSSYNLNRLYPRSYTRSGSRERTESIGSSGSTIPKYSGRTSSSKDDSKYSPLGRISREVSKEDLTTTSSSSSSRYKSAINVLKVPSREDLNKPSQKYINSRFLPKNTVEKSYTAYSRTSSSRTNEVSRKNRELLNVLSAQNEDRSRPTSRCSSIAQDELKERLHDIPKIEVTHTAPTLSYSDMETVTVVTRSTSPNLSNSQSSVVRTKRVDNARTIEKQITRSRIRPEMIDKQIQSDRLDDSTKSSRFAGASRIATYLDLKYSSPSDSEKQNKNSENSSQVDPKDPEEIISKKDLESPKSLSRNSSSKSLSYASSKSDSSKEIKNKSSQIQYDKSKSKLTPPKSSQTDSKKQLPPQVPKSDSPSRTFNPLSTPNKDFRKSVLNMSTDGKLRKKSTKRSNSVSSADSDGANSEATEISENLSSCAASYPKSSSISKLPQKMSQDESQRNRRSCTRSPTVGSETSSAATSSSEDDAKARASRSSSESKLKKLNIALSRASIPIPTPDDPEKSPKPPLSPRVKGESPRNEAEAKSFLMRALAPVTNLFKATRQDSSDKLNWLDNTCDNISEIKTDSLSSDFKSASDGTSKGEELRIPTKIEICRVQPADDNEKYSCQELKSKSVSHSEKCDINKSGSRSGSNNYPVKLIRHVDSDEIPWWLQEKPDIPEGVVVWPATGITAEGITEDGRMIYKVRNDDSPSNVWWFEETAESRSLSSNKSISPKLKLLKHIDSGEKAWWLDENAQVPEGVKVYEDPYAKIRSLKYVDSGEKAWWLDEHGEVPEGICVYQQPLQNSEEDLYEQNKDTNKKLFWIGSSDNDSKNDSVEEPEFLKKYKIRHIDSGERAWWLSSVENLAEDSKNYENKELISCNIPQDEVKDYHEDSDNESECPIPLGDRASPEGLETPREDENIGRISPFDNIPSRHHKSKNSANRVKLFISKHTNIDDVLGGSGQLLSPIMSRIFSYEENKPRGNETCEEISPGQVRIHDSTPQRGVIQPTRL